MRHLFEDLHQVQAQVCHHASRRARAVRQRTSPFLAGHHPRLTGASDSHLLRSCRAHDLQRGQPGDAGGVRPAADGPAQRHVEPDHGAGQSSGRRVPQAAGYHP